MPTRNPSTHSQGLSSRRGSRESEFNWDWDQFRRSAASIKLSRWQSVKLFFWNSTDRTVCYRTGCSWAFILIFYPIFACLIVALFVGIVLMMNYIIRTYAKTPIVNKASLTKEPSYI